MQEGRNVLAQLPLADPRSAPDADVGSSGNKHGVSQNDGSGTSARLQHRQETRSGTLRKDDNERVCVSQLFA